MQPLSEVLRQIEAGLGLPKILSTIASNFEAGTPESVSERQTETTHGSPKIAGSQKMRIEEEHAQSESRKGNKMPSRAEIDQFGKSVIPSERRPF